MKKMKKISFIFAIVFFLGSIGFTQSNSIQKVKIPILEISNSQFEKLLEDIVTYESKHCSIAMNRSYFIKSDAIDSATMASKIVIKSMEIDKALDMSYGVFYIDQHGFFVNESMNSFFVKSQDSIEFLKKEEDVELFFIFDDSQTIWEFLLKNGRLQFKWFEGSCEDIYRPRNPLQSRTIEDIEVIGEEVDDFSYSIAIDEILAQNIEILPPKWSADTVYYGGSSEIEFKLERLSNIESFEEIDKLDSLLRIIRNITNGDTSNYKLINDSIVGVAFKYHQKLCSYHFIQKEYKVLKIQSLKNAYLITVEDSTKDFLFSIISLKSDSREGKKIKTGKEYMLQLNFYDPPNPNVIYIGDDYKVFYKINETTVFIPRKTRKYTIVTTPNLQGLYYIPPER